VLVRDAISCCSTSLGLTGEGKPSTSRTYIYMYFWYSGYAVRLTVCETTTTTTARTEIDLGSPPLGTTNEGLAFEASTSDPSTGYPGFLVNFLGSRTERREKKKREKKKRQDIRG
jgi:hypothetical protein